MSLYTTIEIIVKDEHTGEVVHRTSSCGPGSVFGVGTHAMLTASELDTGKWSPLEVRFPNRGKTADDDQALWFLVQAVAAVSRFGQPPLEYIRRLLGSKILQDTVDAMYAPEPPE